VSWKNVIHKSWLGILAMSGVHLGNARRCHHPAVCCFDVSHVEIEKRTGMVELWFFWCVSIRRTPPQSKNARFPA